MSSTVNSLAHPPDAPPAALKRIFRDARRDPELAVLEGLHALKHALRFGAQVLHTAVLAPERLRALADALAPDVSEPILADAQAVPPDVFATLAPLAPATGVIAIARRPSCDVEALLAAERPAPVVLLESPSDLGNIGACVRVAAAADAAGVLTTGIHDPWDPAALRGGAGLHFALPVARLGEDALEWIGERGRPGAVERPVGDARIVGQPADRPTVEGEVIGRRRLVALDPDGEPLRPHDLPARAVLAFGAERQGLSRELLERADARVSLPMREGVSSLNLATSVAAVLYSRRLVSASAAR
ncbi:MAG TPA: TrmH family RNA methyltransferase [Solirubrobacteraceae bacterium]|nr:TrmH family RNA methyltransferase [Solirubrobacteraceae bacterium]